MLLAPRARWEAATATSSPIQASLYIPAKLKNSLIGESLNSEGQFLAKYSGKCRVYEIKPLEMDTLIK